MANDERNPLLRLIRRIKSRHSGGETDGQLLEQFARAHDEAAFEVLLRRHGPMVLGTCRRLLHNRHDAEDAFQATFLVLCRKAGSIGSRESLGGWLYKVAFRTALKAKANASRRFLEARDLPETPDPCEALVWRDLRPVLDEELSRLPEKYRFPLILCYLEGKTVDQAAGELGWPRGTVASRLARAKESLRSRLTRRGLTLTTATVTAVLSPKVLAISLPATLAQSTLKVTALFALGQAALPGAVAAGVAVLAQGVLKTMLLTKLKVAAGVLLAGGILAAGAGVFTHHLLAEKPAAPDQAGDPKRPAPSRPAEEKQVRIDRYGDPLPAGAIARMGTVRFRSGAGVACLAISPDGKLLAIGSEEPIVRLLDASSGKEVRPLKGNHWEVHALAFSPDGKTLVAGTSGAGEGAIRRWDVGTGNELPQLMEPLQPREQRGHDVQSVCFLPDGKVLAAAINNDRICMWEASSGLPLSKTTKHDVGNSYWHAGAVLAFAPDGKVLASAGTSDGKVHLYDVPTGKEVRRLTGDPKAVYGNVAFSPDGRLHAAVGYGKSESISLWDIATGVEIRQLHPFSETVPEGHPTRIEALGFSPDSKTLATGSRDRTIRLWDIATGQEKRRLKGHQGTVTSLLFSADGTNLFSGSDDATIRIWQVAAGRELAPSPGHQSSMNHLAFSADGKLLATGDGDKTIRLWEAQTGKELRQFEAAKSYEHLVALSPDGRFLAAASGYNGDDYSIYLWDVATGKELHRCVGHEKGIKGIAFAPDSKTLISAGAEGTIRIWATESGKELRQFQGLAPGYGRIALAPNGKLLAVAGVDSVIHLWDLAAGREDHSITTSHHQFWSLAFSPDGKYLVTGSADKMIKLWDVATGRELRQFTGHEGWVHSVTFSPNGRLIASASGARASLDSTLRLWEVATGQEILRFRADRGRLVHAAFSPDGKRVASGGMDTTALIWDVYGLADAERRPSVLLSKEQQEAAWADLMGEDAARAFQAIRTLLAAPKQAVPLLQQRLRAVRPADSKRAARLLAGLDSDDFQVREKVTQELEKLGESVDVQAALMGQPSAEVRRRIEGLLAKQDQEPRFRVLRAVEALELIGTAEARQVLRTLAEGASGSRLTQEAKASLTRLAKR